MTTQQYRKKLLRGQTRPFVMTNAPQLKSLTDPTLAMTGKQLFICAMQGIPIPEPPVLHFTGVKASELSSIDSLYMDKFERIQRAQQELQSIDNVAMRSHRNLPTEPVKQ